MRRLLAFLVGNWPLKLGAVVLATVLYGGVVLSQNTRTWPGQVPIEVRNPPRDAAVLDALRYVTNIQFRAPLDVTGGLTNGSFFAFVDLANVQVPTDGSQVEVPVTLSPVDASVEIADYQPKVINLTLDPVVTQTRPITVDHGQVPEALTIGPPQVDPQTVSITGARSRVLNVRTVVAGVTIDGSGLNVDQGVDLQALDENGAQVVGVQLQPSRARVRIDVSLNQASVQLPVHVQLTGALSDGYQISSVTVTPVSVTVSGEAPVVKRLGSLSTLPVDLGARDTTFSTDVALDVPPDVTVDGSTSVHVQVVVEAAQASRTLEVGLLLRGARPDLIYTLGRPSVLVTLGGSAPLLDGLQASDLEAILQVGSLPLGTHQVSVSLAPPTGLQVVSITPTDVPVTVIAVPQPTPSPSPEPSLSPPISPVPSATP